MIKEFDEEEAELLISAFAKLPLFARTIIYLASGAMAIKDPFAMNQFAETGQFFPVHYSVEDMSNSMQTAG